MHVVRSKHLQLLLSSFALPAFFLVLSTLPLAQASAQQKRSLAVQGYITSVDLPGSFNINGVRVVMGPETGFGLEKDKAFHADSPLRNEVQVGAYVFVLGSYDDRRGTATASAIVFRGDWDETLEGTGVIDKVASSGPEPVFCADGYDIRITPKTATSFSGSLKTISDVGTNVWLRYEGRRDKSGQLVASQVQFLSPKPTKFKALKGWEVRDLDFRLPKAALKTRPAQDTAVQPPDDGVDQETEFTEDGYIRLGMLGHMHKIPADNALQTRVRRVGMRVVPAYQKLLPTDNPSKIHFRFYAYDDEKLRSELCANDGIIMVPIQVVKRLQNDDQLAAVLADGVAFNLQRQSARIVANNRAFFGTQVAGDVAAVFIPGLDLAALVGNNVAARKIKERMERQRGRIALELMADAGFDAWQAPQAWRLLEPKHLPRDLESLRYPDLSLYQLGILNLQYREAAAGVHAAVATGGAAGAD